MDTDSNDRTLDRRGFMGLAAAAGLGVAGRSSAEEPDNIHPAEGDGTASAAFRGIGFRKKYDVIVAGGGVAGVAAAIAAARAGQKTALVEKTIFPGGLATSGKVTWYSPLCDGLGTQVTFGLAEELLLASVKYGGGRTGGKNGKWKTPDMKSKYRGGYSASFRAAACVLAWDELLVKAGVDIWFGTLCCLPTMTGDRVTGIEVENTAGRGLLEAKCIVDATGTCDIAHRAGVPCVEGSNQRAMWALEYNKEKGNVAKVFMGQGDDNKRYKGYGEDVTAFVLSSRKALRERYDKLHAEMGERGPSQLYPVCLPNIPQLRTIRYIEGLDALSRDMLNKDLDDSVGLTADWNHGVKARGRVWAVPYGILVPKKVKGLLTAGRVVSIGKGMWWLSRIIHTCAHTGEIAGIAAALAARNNTVPDALAVADVQKAVKKVGIAIRYEPKSG